MKVHKKIYHYAPVSPAYTACAINECNYLYKTSILDVNCKNCLRIYKAAYDNKKCNTEKCENLVLLDEGFCKTHGGVIAGI
jgi:hypothetical protein